MSIFPKAPEPRPAPTPPVVADATAPTSAAAAAIPESLISTSARGLKRKAATVKPSLIGGGSVQ